MMNKNLSKREELEQILCSRIEKGFYFSREFPGVPYLSDEFGLNHITIRRALNELVERGVLCRKSNGRIDLPDCGKVFRIALLTHGYMTPADKWFAAIKECAQKYKCSFTYMPYYDCHDPIIYEGLDGDFDLIIAAVVKPDKLLLEKMNKVRDKLVCLYHDIADSGFYILDGIPRSCNLRLYRKFAENGFKRIDFFAVVQDMKHYEADREYFVHAGEEFGFKGKFYSFEENFSKYRYYRAREEAQKLIEAGAFSKTEVLFTSNVEVAWGLIRALHDNNIRVPEDIQVVSFGGAELAEFVEPEITTIRTPDRKLPVEEMFEHFLGINPQPGKKVFYADPGQYTDEELIFSGKTVRIPLI
jgi:hypothetical protein